ncbi:Hint domain-containing protein [Thioclava pacifica]|uniref:Hedgehog/Intein (Hint) domain-containing protein n=1 Tax=Thioclava pacifica DSM 10166 TaxID=1353537 RepID=A0A074J886_9RHOB|nr:Hint domain-containing protein [Thioclava pacifica]KEO51823.1 hypothetical protein TP2_10110 [Thioclava pacifica DSM 10166]
MTTQTREIFDTAIRCFPAPAFARRIRERLNDLRLEFSDYDSANGQMTGFDAQGEALFAGAISDFVAAIPCFTLDTLLTTESGPCRVADLAPDARLVTRDNGIQPLRWIGERVFAARDLALNPLLRPVRIRAGSLGPDIPQSDLVVSPNHRILSLGSDGQREAMVMARDLVGNDGVEIIAPTDGVRYLQLLCDHHEMIMGEGAWVETFRPTPDSLAALEQGSRAELLAQRPDLFETSDYRPVRHDLSAPQRILHDA